MIKIFIEFVKRPGHQKILKYILNNGENYVYNISKDVYINVGQVYTYLKELEELNLLKSRIEIKKDSKRKIRIFNIDKNKINEINEFLKTDMKCYKCDNFMSKGELDGEWICDICGYCIHPDDKTELSDDDKEYFRLQKENVKLNRGIIELQEKIENLEIDNNLTRERIKKIENDSFDNGYVIGLENGRKSLSLCPYCEKKIVESVHHIIPKKYGGYTEPDNIIVLCNKCHDEVEILTDELLKYKRYDSKELRFYIESKSFPNYEKVFCTVKEN